MKILTWNCRGLGKARAVRELTAMVRRYKPMVVGLMETKIDQVRLERLRIQLGNKCGLSVERRGIAGGLTIWWEESLDLRVFSYSNSHIDSRIEAENNFRFTLFYGSPIVQERIQSWRLLDRLGNGNTGPWIVSGDFNEVCYSWEVKGRRQRKEWQMKALREALSNNRLTDLSYVGQPFTFSNRREGTNETRARLDRSVANPEWSSTFYKTQIRSKDYGKVVKEAWESTDKSVNSLSQIMEECSRSLQKWNKFSFGNIHRRMKQLEKELEEIKLMERTETIKNKEAELGNEMDEIRRREELMWKQ